MNHLNICKYNTYEDNSDHKAHIEIYSIGSDSSTQYFIYRVIEPKNGGSNQIRMMACYNPSFRGEQIVPVDTYDIWSNETPINGKSNANYFLGDFRTSCPAYAGVKTANFVEPETQQTVTASTFYYGAQGSVAGDNVRVGTVSEVGDGYTKRIGFNPATVKSLAELYGKTKQKKTYVKNSEKYEKNLCNMPATLKTLRVLSYIIMIGRYVAVLLLMIFLTLDVYKCFINDGDFKKIQKSVIIRISCAVAIFFIPVIVNSFAHLVSKNEDSAFHNCSVCFFKDKFNSYNECEKKIEELGEKVENSFVGDALDKKCTDPDRNGYNDARKTACVGVPDQQCMVEWDKSHPATKYVVTCKCANDDFNGYNDKVYSGCHSLQNTMPAEYEKCVAGYKSSHQKYVDECITGLLKEEFIEVERK